MHGDGVPAVEFDLQAHRGGLGLTVENTLAAFQRALEVGVSTLEMDVQITLDGQAVVAHDRDPQPERCLDTGPAWPGDPMFPYVRDETYLAALTLDQVRTIDVGTLGNPAFPDQVLVPGARMPLLAEVLEVAVDRYHGDPVFSAHPVDSRFSERSSNGLVKKTALSEYSRERQGGEPGHGPGTPHRGLTRAPPTPILGCGGRPSGRGGRPSGTPRILA